MWAISEEIGKSILAGNAKRESILSKYACKSARAERLYPDREKIPDNANIRPSFSSYTRSSPRRFFFLITIISPTEYCMYSLYPRLPGLLADACA